MDIRPSTAAAVGGGGVSVAFVTFLDWILNFWHISMTAPVAAALATIFAAAGAYFAPRSKPTPEQVAEIKQQVWADPTTPL